MIPSIRCTSVEASVMMGLEQALQYSHLLRQVNALIVAHLRDNNLTQAATAVATATMTPLNVDVPPNKLLDLVCKGIADETNAIPTTFDHHAHAAALPLPIPIPPPTSLDFSGVQNIKGGSKSFPKHDTRRVSEHKNAARCARFSPDGQYFATGSADTSIKLFEVAKVRQMMMPDSTSRDGSFRPVIRTFYDHMQPINDLGFHPQSAILISGAKDNTIKFFDFAKTSARKACRIIQDTHNVRSVAFHPSGDFILAGTDHHVAHLYDIHTFECYLSSTLQEKDSGGAINQVQYSNSGGMYVTASKDGGVRIWDGVTAQCVRAIVGAHGSAEANSASFSNDQRYVLSCGKDSTVKLWEVGSGRLVKQYVGAQHTHMRCQAVFNQTEEFILSVDEASNEVVIWDSITGEVINRWPSNHSSAPRWLEHSPAEAAFVTCGMDHSVRFWKEAI